MTGCATSISNGYLRLRTKLTVGSAPVVDAVPIQIGF